MLRSCCWCHCYSCPILTSVYPANLILAHGRLLLDKEGRIETTQTAISYPQTGRLEGDWKTWGSRLIKVTPTSGKRGSDHLGACTLCYAPTFVASRKMKEAFYDGLQSAVDEIPTEGTYMYVILGDSAQVGSWNEDKCQRSEVPVD